MTNEQRFNAIRRRHLEAVERRETLRAALLRKYGPGHALAWYTRGEQTKLEALDRAEERVMHAMFSLLDRISPRQWRTGVAAWWVMEKLIYSDAITTGALSELPKPGYGSTIRDAERFALPVREEG